MLFDANGVRIHCVGGPVVLLHGFRAATSIPGV